MVYHSAKDFHIKREQNMPKGEKICGYKVKIINYDVMISQHPNTCIKLISWQLCDSERILWSAGLSTTEP